METQILIYVLYPLFCHGGDLNHLNMVSVTIDILKITTNIVTDISTT